VEIWNTLFDILALLLGALIIGTLLERLRQSAVVGFLCAGMLLGPHGLDIVTSSEEVTLLAELGVSLLLFSIGLEFSRSRLARLKSAGILGVLQVLITAMVGIGISTLLGLEWKAAVGIGLIISLSSTACVLRVLTDRSQLDSGPGRNALGVLLVQDVAVIPLSFAMEFLSIESSGPSSGPGPVALLFGAIGFGVALWAVLRYGAAWFLGSRVISGNRELSLLLAVVTGLGAAGGAHAFGVSPALGAFIAGIVLAGSPFAVQVRSDVGALKTLLLTLFFGSVGMLADPGWITQHILEVLALLAGLIFVKALIVAAIVRLISGHWKHGVASGLALAQIGEFSFLLMDLGQGTVVTAAVEPYLVSVILLSLLVTPYLVTFGRTIEQSLLRTKLPDSDEGDSASKSAAVLLVGFGPSGQRAAIEIARTGKTIRVLDLNSASVLRARSLGHQATVGDASQPEVLEHLDLQSLEVVVVTLPDPNSVELVLQAIARLKPGLPVVVRARYHIHRHRFEQHSPVRIVDEEEEVGVHLGEHAVKALGQELAHDQKTLRHRDRLEEDDIASDSPLVQDP